MTPDELAEIEQRNAPGTALTLNQLIAAARTTHPHTGDEPVIIQGCVVSSEKTLRETVRRVWFHDVPALLAEVKRLRRELVAVRYELSDTRLRRDDARAGREDAEENAQQAARLKAAEDVCVLYGWSAAQSETARQKAAFELWRHWYGIVGPDFMTPDAHPDLSDEMVALLAAQRDETRAGALAKIRGEH